MAFLDELETNIKNSLGGRQTFAPAPAQVSPVWLFALILVLATGVYTVVKFKAPIQIQPTNGASQWTAQQQPSANPNWPWQPQQPTGPVTTEQKVDSLKAQYDKLDAAARKIWDRTKWNSDRMTLLATVNNHNLVVISQNYPKTELIFLNEDWTINRMPNRIQLDATDQAFIQQFVRK
jgi:hypothetical protein